MGPKAEAAEALHDAGAVILLAHPEEFSVQELIDMPVDGFEMYNLHANMVAQIKAAAQMIPVLTDEKEK